MKHEFWKEQHQKKRGRWQKKQCVCLHAQFNVIDVSLLKACDSPCLYGEKTAKNSKVDLRFSLPV